MTDESKGGKRMKSVERSEASDTRKPFYEVPPGNAGARGDVESIFRVLQVELAAGKPRHRRRIVSNDANRGEDVPGESRAGNAHQAYFGVQLSLPSQGSPVPRSVEERESQMTTQPNDFGESRRGPGGGGGESPSANPLVETLSSSPGGEPLQRFYVPPLQLGGLRHDYC